jgi:hypothetical protein
MPKYIILNGAPKSGKDTIGQALHFQLRPHYQVIRRKLAEPIKRAVGAFLGLTTVEADHYFENPVVKDHPSKRFFGTTPRQVLISFSEDWVKPNYGKQAFGEIMLERTKDLEGVVVITDCGFTEEIEVFDPTEAVVVRLHRDGCSFQNDSRSLVYPKDFLSFDVYNDREPEYVAEEIIQRLQKEGFLNVKDMGTIKQAIEGSAILTTEQIYGEEANEV